MVENEERHMMEEVYAKSVWRVTVHIVVAVVVVMYTPYVIEASMAQWVVGCTAQAIVVVVEDTEQVVVVVVVKVIEVAFDAVAIVVEVVQVAFEAAGWIGWVLMEEEVVVGEYLVEQGVAQKVAYFGKMHS